MSDLNMHQLNYHYVTEGIRVPSWAENVDVCYMRF